MSETYHKRVHEAVERAHGQSSDITDAVMNAIPNGSLWLDGQWVQTQKQWRVASDNTYREVYEPIPEAPRCLVAGIPRKSASVMSATLPNVTAS